MRKVINGKDNLHPKNHKKPSMQTVLPSLDIKSSAKSFSSKVERVERKVTKSAKAKKEREERGSN